MAPGLDKRFLKEDEVIDSVYTTLSTVSLAEQLLPKRKKSRNSNGGAFNTLRGKGFYFEDSQDIRFSSVDLFYKRSSIRDGLDMSLDLGSFEIEKKALNRYTGIRYGATVFFNNWSFRLGTNVYDDFSEVVPTLRYENRYENHAYSIEFTRQNALFYTYSLSPYETRLSVNHLEVQDAVEFERNRSLWISLSIDAFDDGNTAVTPQFDYQFYYDTLIEPDLSYTLALEGWYTAHSTPNEDYYSPDFYDSTLIRIDPHYYFSKAIRLEMKAGLGYSIYNNAMHYKYGAWLMGEALEDLGYSLGCLKSNSARGSSSGDYDYLECKAELVYRW